MKFAKITARGQTTIPKSIRKAPKVTPGQDDYLQGLSEVLSEWVSPEDEEA